MGVECTRIAFKNDSNGSFSISLNESDQRAGEMQFSNSSLQYRYPNELFRVKKYESVPCIFLSLFSLAASLLYVCMHACMYVFLSAPPFMFRRTSFNPRVRVSPPPDRNDRTILSITSRNPNICTVIPSLRFSLPLT